MAGAVIITASIISCLYGYFANNYFEGKYSTPAVNIGMIVIQSVFMLLAMLTLPNPDVTGWFVLWTVLLTISYLVAIVVCKQQCESCGAIKKDTIIALLAQILIPLGVALLIIILIVLVMGGSGKKKRK